MRRNLLNLLVLALVAVNAACVKSTPKISVDDGSPAGGDPATPRERVVRLGNAIENDPAVSAEVKAAVLELGALADEHEEQENLPMPEEP